MFTLKVHKNFSAFHLEAEAKIIGDTPISFVTFVLNGLLIGKISRHDASGLVSIFFFLNCYWSRCLNRPNELFICQVFPYICCF